MCCSCITLFDDTAAAQSFAELLNPLVSHTILKSSWSSESKQIFFTQRWRTLTTLQRCHCILDWHSKERRHETLATKGWFQQHRGEPGTPCAFVLSIPVTTVSLLMGLTTKQIYRQQCCAISALPAHVLRLRINLIIRFTFSAFL